MVHQRARAREYFSGIPGGLENNGVYMCVCVCTPEGKRDSEKDEWRERKKGTSPKCARLTRSSDARRRLSCALIF